ncbi:MAG: type II secretion system F family protein [Candidatus Hydrogenedentes bacterium]|nr:type II secretion system F family protein [Candidatus Hydrogenedentota bacterium]
MAILSSQISTKAMVPVCRQLATMYEAGIPITKAIEHVGSHSKDPSVRKALSAMGEDLRGGATLAEAAQRQSKYLSPFFVQLLASGEQGGRLDVMLKDLAEYFEDRLSIQRSVVAAMAYPVLLLTIAWFLGSFALGMVREALASMDDSTRGGVSGVMDYFGVYASFQMKAMLIVALLCVGFIILARLGVLSWLTGAVTTHIWPLSKVTRYFGMARFFRSFSLLIGSGVSVTQCILAAARVTGNPYIERDLARAVPRVKEGATLVEAFAGSRYMTPLAREMLAVGEESGKLDEHLRKAADYHLKEANHAVQVALTVFTTLLMLGVFALVGGIIIYFWMTLYGGMMDGLGI